MSAVAFGDIPDTRKQQIKDMVANIKVKTTPTLNSFKNSTRTVNTQQAGYQIPLFVRGYTQNTAFSPVSGSNSFRQSNPPTTKSMWVGLSYNAKTVAAQGMLLNDLSSKESLVNEIRLQNLAIQDFMQAMNYAAIGDGKGSVARVTSVAAGTFTGTTAAQTTPGFTKGAHRLQANTVYDIVDESSFAVVGTITPSIDGTGSATVPVATTGTPNNASAYVVEQGSFNKVSMGLGSLISNNDRVFQGLDTTDYPELVNSQVDLNGSAITSATIGTLATKVQIRTQSGTTDKIGRIGHITPGLYHTLAIQGYSGRQYQAAEGKATTSFGEPTKYDDRDIGWVLDADMDEDRVYLRSAEDYAMFEARAFGPFNEDGLDWRQNPGAYDVGAWEYYKQLGWVYNLGFDPVDGRGGAGCSALIIRAAVTTAQVGAY